MTVADIPETQFLSKLAQLTVGRDDEPTQGIVIESPFFRTKTVLDRILGLVLLLPALPLIGILVVAVRLTSRGPGIFRQVRVGKGGRIFTMYKLRSMRLDAEANTGPAWSVNGADPRVTKLGYWLRRLHFDELPQLFNVIRGEMSLIGPRPERPEFVHILGEQIPGYLNRLMVPPGITGLAQINLPPDSDLDSVRRKLTLDCDYIRTAGLWVDLRILFCTILRMAWIKGPAVTRFLGLERIVFLAAATPDTEPVRPISLTTLTEQIDRLSPNGHAAASEPQNGRPRPAPASTPLCVVSSPESSD